MNKKELDKRINKMGKELKSKVKEHIERIYKGYLVTDEDLINMFTVVCVDHSNKIFLKEDDKYEQGETQ